MIKFLDLQKVNQRFEVEINQAIQRVVSSGWYLLGAELKSFETNYSNFIGSKHCIGVANGLDALRIILRAYIEIGKLSPGDEILVPANTYIATILSITENNLTPVFVEPNLDTYNIDVSNLKDNLSKKTKCIMLVHLYGQNAYTHDIGAFCKENNLLLIEDNAQAQGCYFNENRTGSLGNAAGHSFYPGKNLGALGDAGAITTSDDELSDVTRRIANYGSKKKYLNDFKGLNSRLDEIQAAILSIKLKYLDEDNQKRREIAHFYQTKILNPKILNPKIFSNRTIKEYLGHVWHLYVIRCNQRDYLMHQLEKEGIQTLIHYPIPPHKQDAYREFNNYNFPITELIHKEVLSLPISPVITINQAEAVVNIINKYS